jgi:hypothetical protein
MFRLSLLLLAAPSLALAQPHVILAPEPGDLSGVSGLQRSPDFTLRVQSEEAFVYHGSKANASELSQQGVSYCNFSFEGGPVSVQIESREPVAAWTVQPTGRTPIERSDRRQARLTIDSPRKLLVTARLVAGGERYFILSAEPPEINPPRRGEPGVLWLEPGVHRFGRSWNPFTGGVHTVYLAPGAVVEATLKVTDQSNLRLTGRGLFIQSVFDHARTLVDGNGWYADFMGMYFRNCDNLVVEGIASLCSPAFQLEVADCDNVVLRNLKLTGFGDHNNDGIHVYSRNVLLEDSFIAGNDDRICLNGLFDRDLPLAEAARLSKTERLTDTTVSNIHLRGLVFWGLKNGADIMITWNSGQTTERVLVEDCDSLSPTNKAFVSARHAGSGSFSNLVFRNCRLEHGHFVDIEVADSGKYWGRGGGSIGDILFADISLTVPPPQVAKAIRGRDAHGAVGPITFRNIIAAGEPVTELAQTTIEVGEHVRAIRFEETPSTP